MPSIIEKIQARLELFRLEQRYTRNRHRRSTFISNAVYVDGEYVYQTPNATGSSTSTSATSDTRRRSLEEPTSPVADDAGSRAQRKRAKRFSVMPGFGSSARTATPQDWSASAVDTRQVR